MLCPKTSCSTNTNAWINCVGTGIYVKTLMNKSYSKFSTDRPVIVLLKWKEARHNHCTAWVVFAVLWNACEIMECKTYLFDLLIWYIATSSVRSAKVTTIRLKSWTPTTRETTRPEIRHHNWRGLKTESTSASFAKRVLLIRQTYIDTSEKCTIGLKRERGRWIREMFLVMSVARNFHRSIT